jgi:prolyl-tRNA synthetase
MMNVYADFAQNFMAIPVVKGIKQKQNVLLERKKHIVLRPLMQDGSATSRNVLQVKFLKVLMLSLPLPKGKTEYAETSWEYQRLMGALVMTHSDDQD